MPDIPAMGGETLFEIKLLGNKSETVKGEVFGDLGVHLYTGPRNGPFINPFRGDWRVTHIPSGGIVREYLDRESAIAMAKKLDAAKIPGQHRIRIRHMKSGATKITDPEGALARMKEMLDG